MKNKQIHQLLEDIDQVEKDGVEFQNKVSRLNVKIIDFILLSTTARFARLRASLRIRIQNLTIPQWSAYEKL